jgi:crotonobetainyl-CoA:carnitine CoA-transferase CaiB-like acyl-CoA transferase
MSAATLTLAHADGFSAVGVACAELVALYAKRRGYGGQKVVTTMLATMAQVLSEDLLDYPGRPAPTVADKDLYGFGPLYQLYETAAGWVFLAAPSDQEWALLSAAIPDAGLGADDFATSEGRSAAADALREALSRVFKEKSAAEWEALLTPLDIACVEVEARPSHEAMVMPGQLGDRLGITTTVDHPLFGEHPRLKSVVTLSRSATRAGAPAMLGEHTHEVLAQFGFSEADRARLIDRKVVAVD